jgi:hypothetical protein
MNVLPICYIQPASIQFIHHLSQNPFGPVPVSLLFDDSRESLFVYDTARRLLPEYPRQLIPAFPSGVISTDQLSLNDRKNLYASWVFLNALDEAIHQAHRPDYIFYIEDDCRFAEKDWGRHLFAELGVLETHLQIDFENNLTSSPRPLSFGTPICWNAHLLGPQFKHRLDAYLALTLNYSGVPVAFEGHESVSCSFGEALYPNGALAAYHLPTVAEYFKEGLLYLRQFKKARAERTSKHISVATQAAVSLGNWFSRIIAFDLFIGIENIRRNGIFCFDNVIPLQTIYSGYGNKHFNEFHRYNMLTTGRKAAVHHLKPSELMALGVV